MAVWCLVSSLNSAKCVVHCLIFVEWSTVAVGLCAVRCSNPSTRRSSTRTWAPMFVCSNERAILQAPRNVFRVLGGLRFRVTAVSYLIYMIRPRSCAFFMFFAKNRAIFTIPLTCCLGPGHQLFLPDAFVNFPPDVTNPRASLRPLLQFAFDEFLGFCKVSCPVEPIHTHRAMLAATTLGGLGGSLGSKLAWKRLPHP